MCGGARVNRNGYTPGGKIRWRCNECGKSSVRPGLLTRRSRQRVWFERWICEGYSVRQLSSQSGYGASTVRRIIRYWLAHPPHGTTPLSACRYLVVDGTYLQGRESSIVALMDAERNEVLAGAYGIKEGQSSMIRLCEALAQCGLSPVGITMDGNPFLYAGLRSVWPSAVFQRCLVHVQRQGLSWCRRNPSRRDARRLRKLFQQVSRIRSLAQRNTFISDWSDWEQRYGWRIAESPERGWVFSDLKRARSMLVRALPFMFTFLKHPNIAHSTNLVEGYFGRMKQQYRQHRGLAEINRKSYFDWYFHLRKR